MNSWSSLGYIESAFTFSLTVMYSNRFPHPFTRDEREAAAKLLLSASYLGGVKGKLWCSRCFPSVAAINTRTKSNLGEEKG